MALSLVACSIPAQESETLEKPKVMLPTWSGNAYQWKTESLDSISNLSTLAGSEAQFFMSPTAIGRSLVGVQPRIRTLRRDDGTHVMTDQVSQNLVTLYHHLESLHRLEKQLGISELLSRPRKVGVQVISPKRDQNNALYSAKFDAILFLPYSGPNIPITVNAGAVAHEHFHALFHAVVGKQVEDLIDSMATVISHPEEKEFLRIFNIEDDKVMTEIEERHRYHRFLLRAINEGFADVWAWIYTGDAEYLQKTFPQLGSRSLAKSPEATVTRESLKPLAVRATERGREDSSLAYAIGTQWARQVVASSNGDRTTTAKLVLKVMEDLALEIKSLKEEEWLNPAIVNGLFAKHAAKESDCARWIEWAPRQDLDDKRFNCRRFKPDPAP